MIKYHLFLQGGSGEMCGKTAMMMRDSLALLRKGMDEHLDILFETMDAGGEALGDMIKLHAADKALDFRNPYTGFMFLELAAKVKARLNKNQVFNLKMVAPEWFKEQTLLTMDELEFELTKGYGRNLILGSLVCGLALEVAEGSEADKKMGFKEIAVEVVNSNGNYEVRVVFVGSGGGGEGRTNISLYPAILKAKCVEAVRNDLGLQPDAALAYVEKVLRIGVIMIGAAFSFPRIAGLNQDVAGLVSGTLENYPKDTSAAIDAFYLLENDNMPVQASKPSEGNEQFKHHHAIEMVAYAALEDFFTRTDEDFARLKNNPDDPSDKIPIIPNYSVPGRGKATWKNLALPDDYRKALEARLRFAAMLIYWLRPQLELNSEQLKADKLYESEFLCKMYGVKSAKELRNAVSYDNLEEEVVKPFKILLARERMFLRWLSDIAQTGFDWERELDPGAAARADLFSVSEISRLLRMPTEENPNETYPDVHECGGMTGFCLDRLTDCGDGNLYNTKLTPDKGRKLRYMENGKPRAFMDIMKELYDICSDRRERRRLWLF